MAVIFLPRPNRKLLTCCNRFLIMESLKQTSNNEAMTDNLPKLATIEQAANVVHLMSNAAA